MSARHRTASTLIYPVGHAALLLQRTNELGVAIGGGLARTAQQILDMRAAKDGLHRCRGRLAGLLQELGRIGRGRRRRARRGGHAGDYCGPGTAEGFKNMTMASLPQTRQQ